MASFAEPSGSAGESSGSETGSSCLQFGVRSYLHHFYEECSSSMRERDPEDQAFLQDQRSPRLCSLATWKVSLALGLLLLSAGAASLSVSCSTARRIETFGEGDLLFVDARAIRFNEGLHLSTVVGGVLSCLGLALFGVGLWLLLRVKLPAAKELHAEEEGGMEERRGAWETKGGGFGEPGMSITRAPWVNEGKVPVTLSKVESVQPSSSMGPNGA